MDLNVKKILQIKGVSKKVEGNLLIDNISLDLFENDICGFVGPNGSGKTTLIRMITGLIYPTSGEIIINEVNVHKNKREALKNVGAIVESPIFFPYMSGRKNLINLGRITDGINKDNLGKKVDEVLTIVGLEKKADEKVKHYSLGMKQRLGIAQALLGDPQFIILDEPSNGLDPIGMKQLRQLIIELHNKKNITFLISSHLIRELELICNSWILINDGRLIWQGKSNDFKEKYDDLEDMFMELVNQ